MRRTPRRSRVPLRILAVVTALALAATAVAPPALAAARPAPRTDAVVVVQPAPAGAQPPGHQVAAARGRIVSVTPVLSLDAAQVRTLR
ncbi:hypothetical protein AB0J86_00575 [Micromonospora sp. NPDC049559]|uniref:hypothetical protein n=1 Tax=Micromonospora sp. NPDC049559 TaxID=3155923 RepID=UPI003412BCC8